MTKNKEQGTKNKGKMHITYLYLVICCFSCFIFSLSVFIEAMRRRRRLLQSFIMLLCSAGDNKWVSLSRSSQYSVSAHSFRDIAAFTKNSFLLTEYWASVRFAPIDVPERKSCLARVNSCFSSQRYLYRLYTLMANFLLFSSAMLFISISNIQKNSTKEKKKRTKNKEQRAEKREQRTKSREQRTKKREQRGDFCMKEFIEQQIIGAIRELLTKRVNEILRDEEFDTPIIEFGNYGCGYGVSPVILLSSCEKSEKERIIRLAAYSLTITFTLPETFETESQCYAYAGAVCTALKEILVWAGLLTGR